MQYLGPGGAPRGFRTLFSGASFYLPENIPHLEDDILIEKSFSQRLHRLMAPYFDGDLRLQRALISVSAHTGAAEELGSKCAVWAPNTHILEMPFRIMASLLEEFAPELLEKPLYYFASSSAEAAAFCAAFPIEQKHICLPKGVPAPKAEGSFYTLSQMDTKEYTAFQDSFLAQGVLRLDGVNLLRTFGLMAAIIHAVFEAGEKKLWFYGDDFNLALPADNLEILTAGFYLVQAGLPIRKIFALSSKNRLAHSFLAGGAFNPSAVPAGQAFHASLRRFLYEIAKGSLPKVVGWMDNLKQKGSFVIDTGSQAFLHKKIEAHFAAKNLMEIPTPYPVSKELHAAHTLAQDQQIPTIIISEENTALPKGPAPQQIEAEELLKKRHHDTYSGS